MNCCKNCDIAYDSNYCPLCDKNSEIEELKNKISDLENEIDLLKNPQTLNPYNK